jgi:hypothetical protein
MMNPRSRVFKDAERRLGMAYICLLGTSEAVPRFLGDTEGGRPHRVVVSMNPKEVLRSINSQQAYKCQQYKVVKCAVVMSPEHGERIQREIDAMLCGERNQNALEHSFRELKDEDIDVAWDLMLREAQRRLRERGETIELFDEMERRRRIERSIERRFRFD